MLEDPAEIWIVPDMPPVADPVDNSIAPDALVLEVPLAKDISPLSPAIPALPLLIMTEPPTRNSPEALASPAASITFPPVASSMLPAARSTLPPTSALLLVFPTASTIEPLSPFDTAPELI